jgi:predicted metal-dependent hydrolase
MWNSSHAELVAGMNAVSLLMPSVEPLIAGAVRSRRGQLAPQLADVAETFAQQELAHQGHHRAMNAVIRSRYRGIAALEAVIRSTYRWIGRRSPAATLTFAAASETLAHALARWTAAHPTVLTHDEQGRWADGPWQALFTWHLAEEVEHKSVAFDVWRAAEPRSATARGRARLLGWGLTSAVLVAVFATVGALLQLHGERRLRNPLTWVRLGALAVSVSFELLPALVVAATKGHHPSRVVDPTWFATVLEGYDAAASRASAGSDV